MCFAVLFVLAFAVGGTPSYAQEDDTDEFQLEEITVTAQKRLENSQKVAIQMEVIAGEDLTGTEKDNVDDILRDISNIIINKMDDGMRITLRGLGDHDFISGNVHTSAPAVAVNIDGAYSNESSSGQNLLDVERVEVLAGPQSTLYASNSPGGIVNVVTASPKTDKFSVSASAEFGNYGLFDGQLAVNVPIIQDLLAMRLAGHVYERDSWIVGNSNFQDTKTVRLKTMIEPSDTFNATVTVNYSENASGWRLNGQVKLFDYEDGVWANEETTGLPTPVTNPWTSADWEESNVGGANPEPMSSDVETTGFQAEVNWDTAVGSFAFVPYWNERKSTAFRSDVEIYFAGGETTYHTSPHAENANEQKGADLRITSPEDFLSKAYKLLL